MKTMHILSNSHLDREHRHEFQETRLMMVEMLDDVIRIMETDDSYRYFTLDGQAIVLDDYLEMRPHMRPRLQALIRAGRIQIGPWYSLVDCYAVNPESIIRNLVVGRRVCREFGEPMPVGYSIFSFGQMAQLPQVYAGFGIHDIVFYKGASAKAFPQSEFIWRSPDGTEAFATRLGREKRWNFFFDFDIPVLLGGDAKRPGWQSRFTDPVKLCHLIDEENRNQYATEPRYPHPGGENRRRHPHRAGCAGRDGFRPCAGRLRRHRFHLASAPDSGGNPAYQPADGGGAGAGSQHPRRVF